MARPPKAPAPDDPGEVMWRRVKASVRPMVGKVVVKVQPASPTAVAPDLIRGSHRPGATPPAAPGQVRGAVKGRVPKPPVPKAPPAKPPPSIGSAPIDRSWERDLKTGRLSPDMTVDLHGHYLAGAHVALSRALDRAAAMGARVILVIAGKQRGPDEAPRGAIRRELTNWLAHSHHSSRILAVRNAHPRHGGAGAVYVVLRKG